jgi:hypothetical protein
VYGQDFLQDVRGRVIDRSTSLPVADANIRLIGETEFSGKSDDQGNFNIQALVGRYKMVVTHTTFQPVTLELLVIAGKQSIINVALRPSVQELSEVEVTSSGINDELTGQRALTIEKTLRIPANFFDPVRVATAFPGVVVANDQGNSIIVRGNTPNGLLWRLNGLDIVNPNHLANAGTFSDKPMANGGGVNILSAQMLGKTDFYTGAVPTTYGNVLSGVIDMELREGNKQRQEYTAQASLIGLDMAAEGPIGKSEKTSYVANYRYSTVGLLSQLGVDFGGEAITFQDLSFHINSTGKSGSRLSLFGFGGVSSNKFKAREKSEWEEDKDMWTINYKSSTYAVGFNYNQPLRNGNIFIAVGYSSSDQERDSQLSDEFDPMTDFWRSNNYGLKNSIVSSQLKFQRFLSRTISWEIGAITDYLQNEIYSNRAYSCYLCAEQFVSTLTGNSDGILIQPFTNVDVALSSQVSASLGLRYVNYSYNSSESIEPRLSVNYKPSANLGFDLSYSLVSQIQTPQVYAAAGNSDLGLTRSQHFDIGINRVFQNDWQLKTNVFYQYIFDVPINVASGFSALNLLESLAPSNMKNDGKGRNYGVDVTAEKQFFRKNYFLVGASYYESKYDLGDDVWRDSRFNGRFTTSLVHGKEWTNLEKRRTISLNTRVLYLGGMRYSYQPGTMIDEETAVGPITGYTEKFKDYFRIDLRLSFRKNKPHYTRTFAIDIQNLTSQQNEAYNYYDFYKQKTVMKYQLGIIPVLVYRIDF